MPSVTAGCLIFLIGLSSLLSAADSFNTEHTTKQIEGWTVLVNNDLLESDAPAVEQAMKLLQVQLAEIVQVVPRVAVTQLQKVPLWFSPEYSGHPPRRISPERRMVTRKPTQSCNGTGSRIHQRSHF